MDVTRIQEYKRTGGVDHGRRGRHESSVKIRKDERSNQVKQRRRAEDAEDDDQVMTDQDIVIPVQQDKTILERLAESVELVNRPLSQELDVLKGALGLRQLLSKNRYPPIKEAFATGVVPRLIELLRVASNPDLQFEVAWALTNITSGDDPAYTRMAVELGVLPALAQRLLTTRMSHIYEQCVWAVGNIVPDAAEYRKECMDNGVLDHLLQKLKHSGTSINIVRIGIWTVSNFFRYDPILEAKWVSPVLESMYQVMLRLRGEDTEVVENLSVLFRHLIKENPEHLQLAIGYQLPEYCLEFMIRTTVPLERYAVKNGIYVLGTIATGTAEQTDYLVRVGAVQALLDLLMAGVEVHHSVLKEVCWVLSNIAAGTEEQAVLLIQDPRVVERLLSLMHVGQNLMMRKEVVWIVSNLELYPSMLTMFVQQDLVATLADNLRSHDIAHQTRVLETLRSLLNHHDQPWHSKAVNDMQSMEVQRHVDNTLVHPNNEIRALAEDLVAKLDEFGDGDEMEFDFSGAMVPLSQI